MEKLAITLRFLATGESHTSLRYQFRISDSAISLFIKPVCDVIYDELKEEYLKIPSTEAEWTDIANKTFQRWHFPNCFAATDGKHIELMHLHNSGSLYINYKKLFSIVLMALADYDYNFLFVDIGFQGCISDGGAFRNYDFYGAPVCNEINLPLPTEVPPLNPGWNSAEPLPFVFVGDDAFPLTNWENEALSFDRIDRRGKVVQFLDALAKIHSGYGAIDSAYFHQEFACNLKKLHHAP